MRYILRELVPSMFQRRLLLLFSAALAAAGLLAVQLARLTVAQGQERRVLAERALTEQALITTVRGQVLDRHDKVLARDIPANDVAVMYDVINGDWAYARARHDAFVANKARWPAKDPTEQEALIAQYQAPYEAQVETMWKTLCELGHIDRPELVEHVAAVVARVQKVAAYVQMREQATGLTDPDDPTPLRRAAQEVLEQRLAHTLLTNVDETALVKLRTLMNEAETDPALAVWKQVSIVKSHARDYPLETQDVPVDRQGFPSPIRDDQPLTLRVEGVGMHLVGLLRPAYEGDIDARPLRLPDPAAERDADLGGYQSGDKMGAWGIERAQERWLRGTRGQVVAHLDSGEETTVPPVAGRDVKLTIDIALQARIMALMDPSVGLMKVQKWQSLDPESTPEDQPERPVLGQPLNGAAVVLDVASGQVLAAVSTPALSLQRLRDDSLHRRREDPDAIWNDKINDPFLDRAVAWAYPPGSTVKPMVLAAAVTDRKLGYDETITCNGYMDPGHPDRFRCWIFKEYGKTHGALTGPQAIENSCNIFFYTLGQRLGAQRLTWWFGRFGLGQPLGCGLIEEVGGILPNDTRQDVNESNSRLLGIGQGTLAWTPLQAANVYATLARGGVLITPTMVMEPRPEGAESLNLGLDARGVSEGLEGMDLVVNEPNSPTGNHLPRNLLPNEHIFNCPGIHVRGKSGTADAPALKINGKVVRQGAHAWFIALVNKEGETRPRYAIAVVAEYGGSGSSVAGPVVNAIIYALRDEGYL